jgi:3-hydroxyacyl-CoA dehydrogenase/3a,7a,12a-trihydroxy-5b-cholest-24-enoyl-CoA hydratase
VRTNVIAPVAVSRMTESLMPPFVHDFIKPEYVSPLVVYLCSEACDANGEIYEVGAGAFCRIETIRSKGWRVKPEGPIGVEDVAEHWKDINDMSTGEILRSIAESTQSTLKHCMS